MFHRFRDRKRWQEFLGFLKQLRARFTTGRLYVVCDNFSPWWQARVPSADLVEDHAVAVSHHDATHISDLAAHHIRGHNCP